MVLIYYFSNSYAMSSEVACEASAVLQGALLPIYQLRRRPAFVMFLTQRRRERALDLPQVDGRVTR
jgi:hypothetical protein